MKLITVVGARPQFVKAAAVSAAFAAFPEVSELLIHTGQHYDANLSDLFFEQLGIPEPAYHLGIGGGRHGEMTGRMLAEIESVLLKEQPDWVLVYGDTNSTLAAALAASKLHIPVAHVEAGLRSFNRRMPEEVNRVLTDHASTLLFTPTKGATAQLALEGIPNSAVVEVGDVMYDIACRIRSEPTLVPDTSAYGDGIVLATIHRQENTDDPDRLLTVVDQLRTLAASRTVVLPLHPRTRGALERIDALESLCSAVKVIEPVGYLEMTSLLMRSALVVTDSGGLQKEAYFFQVPCVTVRDETEWVELVEGGYNRLCRLGQDSLSELCAAAEQSRPDWNHMLYGRGDAGHLIADHLCGSVV